MTAERTDGSPAAAVTRDEPGPWCCPACRGRLAPGNVEEELRCTACSATYPIRGGRPQFSPGHQPSGFPADRREHLEELARDHFWFPPRERLLGRLLDRWTEPGSTTALEAGCGPGRFLPALSSRCQRVVAVDAWDSFLEAAERRLAGEGSGSEVHLAQTDVHRLPVPDGGCDLVAALDVLEHLDDDAAALAELHRVTRPGGLLLLSVPACPGLWSPLDEAAGHRRRYRWRPLRRLLDEVGWIPVRHTHYQCLLFPLVWLSRRTHRLLQRLERRPPTWLGRLLGAVNHFEVATLSGLTLPWGSSLVVVARRRS